MPILQGRLRGKKWIVGSSNHGCWLGSYEFDKQLLFEKMIAPGSIVYDLGGHAGFYTLLASELVGPAGKVFVFEPVPRNLAHIKEHLRINRASNVTVIEAAVSDKSGVCQFDESPNSSMGKLAPDGKLTVKTVALDELIARGDIPAPDYVKIDIEGGEMLALLGARRMLESHPTIFLATHGDKVHQECCQLLQSTGYSLQPIDGLSIKESSEILATPFASQKRGSA
jgi:FkbM family methyltransferase